MPVVMVVEDEAILRRAVARGLRRLSDVSVVEASTLAEARAVFDEEAPAVVVSDIRLPDGCGVDLLAHIAASEALVPVIFVSAWVARYRDRIPDHQRHIEVYEKPVPLDTLRQRVSEQLGRWRTAAPNAFEVADYLQLAHLGRQSVRIRIFTKDGREGHIALQDGAPWSARLGEQTGEAAALALLALDAPRVELEPLGRALGERTLDQTVDYILLEAFRRQDEAEASQEAFPTPVRPSDAPPDPDAPARPRRLTGSVTIQALSGGSSGGGSSGSTRPPSAAPPPRASETTGRPRAADPTTDPMGSVPPLAIQDDDAAALDDLLERGLDALLTRRYADAWRAFAAAAVLRPGDPVIRANLNRIREMGHAPDQ